MKPAKHNLTIYQGSTYRKSFIWKSGPQNSLEPVDISSISFQMQIRPSISSIDYIIDLSTDNGGIIKTDPVNGEFEIFIDNLTTESFNFGKAVYDLEYTYQNGETYKLFEGNVILKYEVTRNSGVKI